MARKRRGLEEPEAAQVELGDPMASHPGIGARGEGKAY